MNEKKPLNIVHKSDHDFDPTRILQPGYDTFEINIINSWLQATVSTTASFGDVNSASYLDNIAEVLKMGDADSDFPETGSDSDPLLQDLERMVAECWTIVRQVVHKGEWPDIEKYHLGMYIGAAKSTLTTWKEYDAGEGMQTWLVGFEAFKAGIMEENPPYWSAALTNPVAGTKSAPKAADDPHDFADMLRYTMDGDDNQHWQYFTRVFYALGLSMKKDFPSLALRIESTTNQTVLYRNIETLYFLAVVGLMDFFVLAAMQSDAAVFNLAGLYESNRNKKVPQDIYKATDLAWLPFVIPDKYNTFTVSGEFLTYTGDFIDNTLLDGTDLDNIVHDWKTTFLVSGWALQRARTLFGIGKYEKRSGTNHFIHLFNGAIPSVGGDYDDHGDRRWTLGLNLSIGLDYLKNRQTLPHDFMKFVNKKSYTWTDINEVYGKFFTPFSVLTSLNGFCEPETYLGMRRLTYYEDFVDTDTTSAQKFRDECRSSMPTAADFIVDDGSTDLVADLSTTMFLGGEWLWLYLSKYVPDHYRLYMPFQWEDQEIYNYFFLGIMFDQGNDISDDVLTVVTDSPIFRRIKLLECIHAKQPDKVECLIVSTVKDQPKFEDVKNVLASTFEDTAMKYAMELIDKVPSSNDVQAAHRPYGWKDASVTYIDDIGHRDVAQQLIQNAIGMSVTAPAKSAAPPKPKMTAVKPQTADEPDDKTEGDSPDGEVV